MTGKELIKFLQNKFTEEELEMDVVYNDTEWGYCPILENKCVTNESDEYVSSFEEKPKKKVIVFY